MSSMSAIKQASEISVLSIPSASVSASAESQASTPNSQLPLELPKLSADCFDSFVRRLRAMPLDSILPDETYVTTTDTPVPQLLRRLADADVLSMPVLDACGTFVGFCGMSELVEFVTELVPIPSVWAYELDSKDISIESWNRATVGDVMKTVTRRNDYALECAPFNPVGSGSPELNQTTSLSDVTISSGKVAAVQPRMTTAKLPVPTITTSDSKGAGNTKELKSPVTPLSMSLETPMAGSPTLSPLTTPTSTPVSSLKVASTAAAAAIEGTAVPTGFPVSARSRDAIRETQVVSTPTSSMNGVSDHQRTQPPTGLTVWQVFELMAERHLHRLCILNSRDSDNNSDTSIGATATATAVAGSTAAAGTGAGIGRDSEGSTRVRGIVTQSMMIRVLQDELCATDVKSAFAAAAHAIPIGAMRAVAWHAGRVVSINRNASAIEAFLQLIRFGIQGIAVVNDGGDLFSVLSIRDLRGVIRPIPNTGAPVKSADTTNTMVTATGTRLPTEEKNSVALEGITQSEGEGKTKESTVVSVLTPRQPSAAITTIGSAAGVRLWQLWCTVERFITKLAKPADMTAFKEPVFGTELLVPTDSLARAIAMLAEDQVHRLFVVRSHTASLRPLSVVSQTDVLSFVLWLTSTHSPLYATLRSRNRYVVSLKPLTAAHNFKHDLTTTPELIANAVQHLSNAQAPKPVNAAIELSSALILTHKV